MNRQKFSGFRNATISKLFLIFLFVLNMVASVIGLQKGGPSVIGYTQKFSFLGIWRNFTGPFIFSSVGEMLFGMLLLYVLRKFEWIWGSLKFFIFLLLSYFCTFIIQLVMSFCSFGFLKVSNGPTGVIAALMIQYFFDIPSVSSWKVLVFQISEKTLIYILFIQFQLSNLPGSLYLSIYGGFFGLIYKIKFLKLDQIVFLVPKKVRNWFEKILKHLNSDPVKLNRFRRSMQQRLSQSVNQLSQREGNRTQTQERRSQPNNNNSQRPDNQSTTQPQQPQPNNNQRTEVQQPEPSEENIGKLVAMGFTRNQAIQALRSASGNLNLAISLLIE